jgi:hypothetical protein
LYCVLCDGVEDNAVCFFRVKAEHLGDMPCDGFPFAVKVGSEIQIVTFFGGTLQAVYGAFFSG